MTVAHSKTYFIYTINGRTYWTVTSANIDCSKFVPAPGVTIEDCWNEGKTIPKPPVVYTDNFSEVNFSNLSVVFKNKKTELAEILVSTQDIENLTNEGLFPILSVTGESISYSFSNENPLKIPNTNQTLVSTHRIPRLLFETDYTVKLSPNPISDSYAVNITPNSSNLPQVTNISITFVNQQGNVIVKNVTNNTTNHRDLDITNGLYSYNVRFNEQFSKTGAVLFE
jgi:hypothetical protein